MPAYVCLCLISLSCLSVSHLLVPSITPTPCLSELDFVFQQCLMPLPSFPSSLNSHPTVTRRWRARRTRSPRPGRPSARECRTAASESRRGRNRPATACKRQGTKPRTRARRRASRRATRPRRRTSTPSTRYRRACPPAAPPAPAGPAPALAASKRPTPFRPPFLLCVG